MDLLNIDLKSFIPSIVDALTYLYGDKYRSSIKEKLNKAILFYFYDLSCLTRYADDYEEYYAGKSAFQFLKANGISEDKLEEAFSSLIQNPYYFVTGKSPILAFGDYYTDDDFSRKLAKVQVINYLLGSSKEIDYESLDDFIRTDEYRKIETIAKKFNEKYEAILNDFKNSCCKEMQSVKDFVEGEKQREKVIRHDYAKKFCKEIMYLLPQKAQDVLSRANEEQLVKIFLPHYGHNEISDRLSEMSCFEAFSNKKLVTSNLLRRDIATRRNTYFNYLRSLGIRDEDLDSYIPGEKQILQIEKARIEAERDAVDNYLITRRDFINFQIQNSNIPLTTDDPLFVILKKQIQKHQTREFDACVCNRMYDDDDMSLRSIMIYSVTNFGTLFYTLLHECTHVCEQRDSYSTGFDIDDTTNNRYDSKYRIYERFNETLSDYFTREGLRFLHSNGKFLIEPEELTNMDYGSNNTPAENALLLEPLLSNPKCREAIIEVKNDGDPEIFIELIGKANFDRLVDVLNYVNFLASDSRFKTNLRLQSEYELARMRAAAIYHDIENYVKARQENFVF